jgi:hypothetical protein
MWNENTPSAQTSVDFLIGISLFTVTLLFVLQVASTSVVNVAPESQTREAIAERAGTIVHQNYTGDGENGNILEPGYDTTRGDLGVPSNSSYDINVTVKNAETGSLTNNTGPDVPSGPSSRVAGDRRVVEVSGETSVVNVRVWGTRVGAG